MTFDRNGWIAFQHRFQWGLPIILCLLLAAGLTARDAQAQEPSKKIIARKASPAIVLIKGTGPDGPAFGSGFLVSSDGKIITALHVISGLKMATVNLASGEAFDAITILGFDKRKDLAILKIPGFDLPTLELGNSNKVAQGEPVVLIGNPEGLQGTVTSGIVSAIRDSVGGGDFKVIQTDAATNPGNSGGPLLNGAGQVIGILDSKMKGAENLNFAIPINYARGMLNSSPAPISLAELQTRLQEPAPETPVKRPVSAPSPGGEVRVAAVGEIITALTLDQLKSIVRTSGVPILDEATGPGYFMTMMNNFRAGIGITGGCITITMVMADKISLEKINSWNEKTRYTYLYKRSSDAATVMELDLYIGLGVTEKTIDSNINYFNEAVPAFLKVLAPNP